MRAITEPAKLVHEERRRLENRRLIRVLGYGFMVLTSVGCALLPTSNATKLPTISIPPTTSTGFAVSVQVDFRGAAELLDFFQALNQGQPWDEATIRQMVAKPPYQMLIAHHSRMDAEVTPEALVMLLLAIRDHKPLTTASERLRRIHTAYQLACDQIPALQTRLEQLKNSLPVEQAVAQAQAALPAQARIDATVYLLLDGRSSGYVLGRCIIIDLLQISNAAEVEAMLAHELHHIGASSLLPAPCPDPCLREALEALADLVQEGAATYWIDNQRFSPTKSDFDQVGRFLQDVLSRQLDADEIKVRRAELVQGAYGPLYRVGNEVIAVLTSTKGRDWVQARLGEPIELLRAWQEQRKVGPAFAPEVFTLIDKAEALGNCPAWFSRMNGVFRLLVTDF